MSWEGPLFEQEGSLWQKAFYAVAGVGWLILEVAALAGLGYVYWLLYF